MQGKLKLQLEDLLIDSFATTPPKKAEGTVFGEQCTCYTACTCPGCPTCDASCNGTCGVSCDGSCGGTCDATCDGGCGTWDWSCGGNTCGGFTCNDTCAGYQTFGMRDHCIIC